MGIPPFDSALLALSWGECRRWHSSNESAKRQEFRSSGAPLILRGSVRPHALADLRTVFGDLGEAHDRDQILHLHLAAVDLLEEVHHLVESAELGVVVLDVAPRELIHPLHVHAVDHGLEDPLAGRVLKADGDHHHLALAVLLALVPEADRRRLATALELVDE